jgi:uncharacterized short protein YbdD (DUF466 family)
MRPTEREQAARAAPTPAAGPGSRLARLRRRIAPLPRALRQLLGYPDYARYLEHCQRTGHPPRLTEREYLNAFFAARGRAPRCC